VSRRSIGAKRLAGFLTERLAFRPTTGDEAGLPEIWSEPLPIVVETLHTCTFAAMVAATYPTSASCRGGDSHGC
jgi:hypothetical protein